MHKCPNCGVSRYKVKDDEKCSSYESTTKGPMANANDTKDLTWDADGRNCDGILRHPADSSQWKNIDVCIQILAKRQEILGLD